jgi:hypothetical protein
MTTISLAPVGMPGIAYTFAGKIRRFDLKEKPSIYISKQPWDLTTTDLIELAKKLNVELEVLNGAHCNEQG